jgi:hypothetical protein
MSAAHICRFNNNSFSLPELISKRSMFIFCWLSILAMSLSLVLDIIRASFVNTGLKFEGQVNLSLRSFVISCVML